MQKLVNRRKSEFFVALVNRRKKVVNRSIEKSCDEFMRRKITDPKITMSSISAYKRSKLAPIKSNRILYVASYSLYQLVLVDFQYTA